MINSISYKFRGFERLRTAERKGKSRKKKSAFSLSKAKEAELTWKSSLTAWRSYTKNL